MPKTTPKQRHSANAARTIIQASKYAEQFAKDPEATIEDVLTDILHLATLNGDVMQSPEDLVNSAFQHAHAEAGPEGMVVDGPKHGRLVTLGGLEVVGSLDSLTAVAYLQGVTATADGSFELEYEGQSEVNWDSQTQVTKLGQPVFVDERGLECQRSELLWVSDEVPKRLGKLDPVHLVMFLSRNQTITNILRRSLEVQPSKKPATMEQIVLALTAPCTTATFRKFRKLLHQAIWSEQYRLNQLPQT